MTTTSTWASQGAPGIGRVLLSREPLATRRRESLPARRMPAAGVVLPPLSAPAPTSPAAALLHHSAAAPALGRLNAEVAEPGPAFGAADCFFSAAARSLSGVELGASGGAGRTGLGAVRPLDDRLAPLAASAAAAAACEPSARSSCACAVAAATLLESPRLSDDEAAGGCAPSCSCRRYAGLYSRSGAGSEAVGQPNPVGNSNCDLHVCR